jgi:hypothetical protein
MLAAGAFFVRRQLESRFRALRFGMTNLKANTEILLCAQNDGWELIGGGEVCAAEKPRSQKRDLGHPLLWRVKS